jgi:hypothetical protein
MGFSLLILVGIALLVAGIARLARGGAARGSHRGGVFMTGSDGGHHHHGGFGGHHGGGHHGGGFGGHHG